MINNIHDNRIIEYTVNLEDNMIIFKTLTEDNHTIKILFEDVLAHLFETELPNSILFDIDEFSGKEMVEDNKDILNLKKDYGWPIVYDTEKELIKKIDQYNYYVINSSYGLSGWILAKRIIIK
jgi:hypothetical protein